MEFEKEMHGMADADNTLGFGHGDEGARRVYIPNRAVMDVLFAAAT